MGYIHSNEWVLMIRTNKVKIMPSKPITKKYLQDRCTFVDKTVLFSTDFDGLYALVKQLNPEEQRQIFKVKTKTVKPLNEDQIDSLLIYLPSEVKENIDFIELTKKEKLDLVRQNKDNLAKIIEKKGYTDKIDLDGEITTPSEEYSGALLWDIIKAKADLE